MNRRTVRLISPPVVFVVVGIYTLVTSSVPIGLALIVVGVATVFLNLTGRV